MGCEPCETAKRCLKVGWGKSPSSRAPSSAWSFTGFEEREVISFGCVSAHCQERQTLTSFRRRCELLLVLTRPLPFPAASDSDSQPRCEPGGWRRKQRHTPSYALLGLSTSIYGMPTTQQRMLSVFPCSFKAPPWDEAPSL